MNDVNKRRSLCDDPSRLPAKPQERKFRGSSFHLYAIRILDILIAAVGLTLSLPLFVVAPLLIKLDSPGRAFFIHKRLGQGGKLFRLLKFRTMFENNDVGCWACQNDHRITRVGWLLRKFHLDEIPQLINVIKGDLSMVGPRPYTKEVHEKICRILPEFDLKLRVKPGITGWAQMVGRHDERTLEHHASLFVYDLHYISAPFTVGGYLEDLTITIKYILAGACHRTFVPPFLVSQMSRS